MFFYPKLHVSSRSVNHLARNIRLSLNSNEDCKVTTIYEGLDTEHKLANPVRKTVHYIYNSTSRKVEPNFSGPYRSAATVHAPNLYELELSFD